MSKQSKPAYQHDCDECVFLDHVVGHDFYYCDKGEFTLVARYGNDGPDYTSGSGDYGGVLAIAHALYRYKQ